MEQDNVIKVMCRDGITARVQRVRDESNPESTITFGRRIHPEIPEFDKDGFRNEGGDIWYKDGFWREDRQPHPFDIVRVVLTKLQLSSIPTHA